MSMMMMMRKKQKPYLIIQTSPMHTASTLLINVLYGLIDELKDKPIYHCGTPRPYSQTKFTVIKSHHTNIDQLIRYYKKDYNLFFVCSQRPEKNLFIDPKYKTYSNVIVFDFDELNETTVKSLASIVKNISDRVSQKNEWSLYFNNTNAVERIKNMNKRYQEIKNKPFSYEDPFFGIHGSHRNRPDNQL